MMFAKKCPKCGGKVQTKSIKKSIGLGFVNIPVAQFCLNPVCDWYQDFSEAKKPEDINETVVQLKIPVSKDRIAEIKKRTPEIVQKNMMVVKGIIVVIVLSLLLIYMLSFMQPATLRPVTQQSEAPDTNVPAVNTTRPSVAASTQIPVTPQVIVEQKKYSIKFDVSHGFSPPIITINKSDTIIWNNEENQRPRLVLVSKDSLFKNKLMGYSDKYQYQFNQSGRYIFMLAEYPSLNEYPNATNEIIVK
ncbi:MAG: hypothetical protein O8C63_00725 [Candidatus Methanoperedens sp.]|nr:hypothetical protein [Candidatus Methanoperedens sp.]